MGFFSKYNKEEQAILDLHTKIFQEMGISEPSEIAKTLLDKAIKKSKTIPIPPNAGDILLEKEKSDQNTHLAFEKKRKEGVKNEDIRFWWNLNNTERFMMLEVDSFHQLALFIKLSEEGLKPEEAWNEVRKSHPIYGNPEDTTHTQGDDRPLPEELKNRINIYILKQSKEDPEIIQKEIEKFPSFNALVRKEIKEGNL